LEKGVAPVLPVRVAELYGQGTKHQEAGRG